LVNGLPVVKWSEIGAVGYFESWDFFSHKNASRSRSTIRSDSSRCATWARSSRRSLRFFRFNKSRTYPRVAIRAMQIDMIPVAMRVEYISHPPNSCPSLLPTPMLPSSTRPDDHITCTCGFPEMRKFLTPRRYCCCSSSVNQMYAWRRQLGAAQKMPPLTEGTGV
jgi:hypothetical protein